MYREAICLNYTTMDQPSINQELRSVKISQLLNPQTGLTENIDGVIKEYKETRGLLVRSLAHIQLIYM